MKNSQKAIELKQIKMMKDDFDAYQRFRPYLSIAFKENEGLLALEITDNGGGLPEEYMDRVFKEPIPSSKKDGYGLGTTFVKFFSDRMGANLRGGNVKTEHGRGFRVTMEIPYRAG